MTILNLVDTLETLKPFSAISSMIGIFFLITSVYVLLFSSKTPAKDALKCILASIFLIIFYGFHSKFAVFKLMTFKIPIYF